MKFFEMPELEITNFDVEDIITTSGGEWSGGEGGNNTGWN